MQDHFCGVNFGLWRIISSERNQKDIDHMTPQEIFFHQLNFRAKSFLQKNMSNELYICTSLCNTAKLIWDSLRKIHEGDESIKGSSFKLRIKYETFNMRIDGTPEQVKKKLYSSPKSSKYNMKKAR
jgi:hypothetical protein